MKPPPEDEAGLVTSDSGVEDVPEDDVTTPYTFTVTSYGADYPVDGLVKRIESKDVVIPTFDPEVEPSLDIEGFQRQFVWTKPQCDRFIESLLLGLPVPGIFLVKQPDGHLLVLDGQQRLRTLVAFYKGVLRDRSFRLDNVQERFRGLTYATLASTDRRRLDDSIIHATIVHQEEPSNDQSSVYLVFERLNTGGTILHPQEIRVALYRGRLIRLLRTLNENKDWRAVFGLRSSRLKDQELILRFCALRFWSDQYRRPMKDFLNRYTAFNSNLTEQDEIELKQAFEATIRLISSAIGEKRAFRLTSALNAALFDSVMVGVAMRLTNGGPVTDLAGLVQAYESLLADVNYRDAIGKSTADEENVRTRLQMAIEAMKDIK